MKLRGASTIAFVFFTGGLLFDTLPALAQAPPTITGFTPECGPTGTTVIINGTNFHGGRSGAAFDALFTSAAGGWVSVGREKILDSQTQMTVQLPAGVGQGPVRVTTPDGAATSTAAFGGPRIESFTPSGGTVGTAVDIYGKCFDAGRSGSNLQVTFNGVGVGRNFNPISTTHIQAVVPVGAGTGPICVSTESGKGCGTANFSFGPTITGFDPQCRCGTAATTVRILGTNFLGGRSGSDYDVQFTAAAGGWVSVGRERQLDSATQISVLVPAGVGDGPIRVTTPDGSAVSRDYFYVSPLVSYFTPPEGLEGAEIHIFGSNFHGGRSGADFDVEFTASGGGWISAGRLRRIESCLEIVATVPTGAMTGPIRVTTPDGVSPISEDDYQTGPEITSFDPIGGTVSATVRIFGRNFLGGTRLASSEYEVEFTASGGGWVSVGREKAVDSSSQITTRVPTGAGYGPIRVTTPMGSVVSEKSFTVAHLAGVDSDGDGADDAFDNCRLLGNPDQEDTDRDMKGDDCDDDDDNDGVVDSSDNCPVNSNRLQEDTDTIGGEPSPDGFGNACDNCPATPNPDQRDGDGDGHGTECDNCPSISNRRQLDRDGDGIGNACDDNCGAPVRPPVAKPDISTQASAGGPLGTGINDVAILSGGSNPTGIVTFNVHGPDNVTCAGPSDFTSTTGVVGNGAYRSTPNFTPTVPGTYRWTASYSGDANNDPVRVPCNAPNESVTITKASPTVSTQASARGVIGTSVSDVATVAGGASPTGNVTFRLFSNNTCTTQVFMSTNAVSGATATSGNFTPAAAGTYYWTAVYNGDANNNTATSPCNAPNESVAISRANPTISTTASPSVLDGGPVHDTTTLSGGFNPTGTVTFRLFSNDTCTTQVFMSTNTVSGAIATSGNFTPAAVGTYYWTAVYDGDANNNTATSPCNAPNEWVVVRPFAPPSCTRNLTRNVTGPITVSARESVCVNNADVVGPITVNPGGALTVNNSQVSNGIVVKGPSFLSMCGSRVTAPTGNPAQGLVVSDAAAPLRIGDPAKGCAFNKVIGDATLTANTAGLTLGANQVSGKVTVNSNTLGNVVIKANIIGGPLGCTGNNPPPTSAGQPNTAAGGKSGQCAAL